MTTPAELIAATRQIDLRDADDQEYALANDFYDQIQIERDPEDPPVPHQQRVANWQSYPREAVDVAAWYIPDAAGTAFVAVAEALILLTGDNAHLAQVDLAVLPTYRRQGLGTHLLGEVAGWAERAGRRLLLIGASDRVPAGPAFLRHLGAELGLSSHVNQLRLSELNHSAVRDWLTRAEETSTRFELGLWDGPYPEEDLPAIANLLEVMNQAPHDDLELEEMHYTPALLREMEQMAFAGGSRRWVFYVRERSSGAFAGFSEIFWNPERPAIIQQGGTGVFPDYRGQGLGGWLKAAMIDKIEREMPEARLIRTSNADSNAAMRKINFTLGFKPYRTDEAWQIEVGRVTRDT